MAPLFLRLLVQAILVVGFYRLLRIGRRPKSYPPGPPTLPILGNLHQMPSRDSHLQFERWAREYGPIYSLILGTKTLIVLTGDEAVKELMDRRSGLYSHRQEMYVGQTLCSGDLRFLMMGYGPTWRMYRKTIHSLLNIQASKSYVPYQLLENTQMLCEMLDDPSHFLHHIRRYSNSLTTTMVYGWRTRTYDDPNMKQLFEGFSEFSLLNQTGTAAIIDFFPILRYLPDWMMSTKRKAKQVHLHEKTLYMKHWKAAKAAIADGTIKPCFCVGMAQSQKAEGFSDEQAAYIGGTLLEAGSDTTSSTLYAFIQAMILYPEVQRKAQQEVDNVVGDKRLPTMDDEPDLPYILGCMKESLRWMPTTILGAVPHAVTKDDTYMGYLIPKNAGVMNNVWGINMDPKRHTEPRHFNPDRYQDDHLSLADSAANPDGTKRDNFTFGAGRRICPGIHVAARSLYLGMSRLLWAFNIEPAVDANGNRIMPDPDELTQGFVCAPAEFPARLTPRSPERAEMCRREWEKMSEALDPETKQWKVSTTMLKI